MLIRLKASHSSRWLVLVGFLSSAAGASAMAPTSAPHHCEKNAREQAEKLLRFHANPDAQTPVEIDTKVAQLASIKNPAGKNKLDVLEVKAYIMKASYRLHMVYSPSKTSCVLLGQEILELAVP